MSLPEYTLEEVSKHNTAEDLWLIINGRVYNVTDFLEKHPGGQKPFLHYAGQDATERFLKITNHASFYNASDKTPEFMNNMCVGTLKN